MRHADFIEALGGGTKVAESLAAETGEEINRDSVYQWRAKDFIPWRWRPHLIVIARREGIKVPKNFVPGVAA